MSTIHYFQRYSSRENWVTNATLLLFSRLYHFDRKKFEVSINLMLGTEAAVETDVVFAQQVGGESGKNIIDGLLYQPSFRIAIETKLFDNQYEEQLKRHLESLRPSADTKVLLALSKNDLDPAIKKRVEHFIAESTMDDSNIKVISATYEGIISSISQSLHEDDIELNEILDDYSNLCHEEGLISLEERTILAVPVGKSYESNVTHHLYYNPRARSHNRRFKYIGLYLQGHILNVGRVIHTVDCDYKDGELIGYPPNDLADVGIEERLNIISAIEMANAEFDYDLETGMRFYLVDDFVPVVTEKLRPIMGKKYFALTREFDLNISADVDFVGEGISELSGREG